MKYKLKVKLEPDAHMPFRAHDGDAGLDLCSMRDVYLGPCCRASGCATVSTGVSVEIPEGYVGFLIPRSSLAKRHVALENSVGVIDSGYRGEIHLQLHNLMERPVCVPKGERICQLVVVPFVSCEPVEVEELSDSERGENGLGSSGR